MKSQTESDRPGDFAMIPRRAFDDLSAGKLGVVEIAILGYLKLHSFAIPDGHVVKQNETLAVLCGVSVRTVIRALLRLEEGGYIKMHYKGVGRKNRESIEILDDFELGSSVTRAPRSRRSSDTRDTRSANIECPQSHSKKIECHQSTTIPEIEYPHSHSRVTPETHDLPRAIEERPRQKNLEIKNRENTYTASGPEKPGSPPVSDDDADLKAPLFARDVPRVEPSVVKPLTTSVRDALQSAVDYANEHFSNRHQIADYVARRKGDHDPAWYLYALRVMRKADDHKYSVGYLAKVMASWNELGKIPDEVIREFGPPVATTPGTIPIPKYKPIPTAECGLDFDELYRLPAKGTAK